MVHNANFSSLSTVATASPSLFATQLYASSLFFMLCLMHSLLVITDLFCVLCYPANLSKKNPSIYKPTTFITICFSISILQECVSGCIGSFAYV